ncbi:hypothetical protein AXY1_4 [Achromobacter phage AXY1]|nr:hypothetical protein AXY1_4 [Achromobacter phage AXY1]
MAVTFCGGVPISTPNTVTKQTREFHVSYNRSSADYGTPTTAINIYSTGQFLVLAGDHSAQLAGLTLAESVAYFYAHVDKAVTQSEHGRVFRFVDGKGFYEQGGY